MIDWKPGPPPKKSGKIFVVKVYGSDWVDDFYAVIHRGGNRWVDEKGVKFTAEEDVLFHAEINEPMLADPPPRPTCEMPEELPTGDD